MPYCFFLLSVCPCVCPCVRVYTRTRTRTYVCMYIRTYIQTFTHTYTWKGMAWPNNLHNIRFQYSEASQTCRKVFIKTYLIYIYAKQIHHNRNNNNPRNCMRTKRRLEEGGNEFDTDDIFFIILNVRRHAGDVFCALTSFHRMS